MCVVHYTSSTRTCCLQIYDHPCAAVYMRQREDGSCMTLKDAYLSGLICSGQCWLTLSVLLFHLSKGMCMLKRLIKTQLVLLWQKSRANPSISATDLHEDKPIIIQGANSWLFREESAEISSMLLLSVVALKNCTEIFNHK